MGEQRVRQGGERLRERERERETQRKRGTDLRLRGPCI